MDHPLDEKISHDITQDDEMENLDEGPIKKTESQANLKVDSAMEVQSDSEKTLKDQDINMENNDKEKNYSIEVMDIQISPTDYKIEINQDTKTRGVDKETNQAVETKTTEEEMEIPTETINMPKLMHMEGSDKYDSSNKLILKSMEDNKAEVTENICSADSTTDANTIIIDLCDDEKIEIYQQTDSKSVLASNINLKSNNKCDSSNKATLEKMEECNEMEGENITITHSNKQTLDTIIIDLCDDDQIETYEQKDGSIQADTWYTLSQNEGGSFPRPMLSNVVTEPKEGREKTEPIQIVESIRCDDSESGNKIETSKIKVIEIAKLKAFEITENDGPEEIFKLTEEEVSEEGCELTDKYKPEETYQMSGEDASEAPCKILLKNHPEGIDSDDSKVKKDDENYKECLETESENIEEKSEASMIKSTSNETEFKIKNKEYELENFRFKDNIITLQEDYDLDLKQINNEPYHDPEKSDRVSEDAKFTILDESDLEEKGCNNSEQIFGVGHEVVTETNTKISQVTQNVSQLKEQETIIKREETNENKNKIECEQHLKLEVNKLEDIQLILIEKEIKENILFKTEKGENSSIKSEAICKRDQHDGDIKVPNTSESTNFPTQVMEVRISEKNNQLTATADIKNEPENEEKPTETNSGREIESCTKNVQLIINLDIVKSDENDNGIAKKQNGIPGCSVKGSYSKVCQTENSENANKNLASAYLTDTPPSLSDSDSNEEFFDAVEYIPEGNAMKETSLTIKPCTALLSTPSLNLMNEPIPGPSGITTMKKRDEKRKTPVIRSEEETVEVFQEATEFSSDEDIKFPEEENTPSKTSSTIDDAVKIKETRKHDDMEDNDNNEKQKKIKLH
ncbi:glutamic acid-rich protein isoform X2 [Halyomorpha halys]